MSQPALLVLEDGRSFAGTSYGATGETFGEAVFTTGMTGYQETLTDPSYHRQIVTQTAPHIGNTGVNDEDDESQKIWVAGYVVRDPARVPSNWRATRSLDDQLRGQGIVGISGIDTRALTRHLRERGAMRAGISTEILDPAQLLTKVLEQPPMVGADLADEVTTAETYVVPAEGEKRFTVVALDLGIKSMTPKRMAERGIEVHVLPATATLDEVLAVDPDGIFMSNGPGDPETTEHPTELLRALLQRGSRTSGSASATRCSAGRSAWARSSSSTGTAGSTSRCSTGPPARWRSPRRTTGSRWTRRSTRRSRRRTARLRCRMCP